MLFRLKSWIPQPCVSRRSPPANIPRRALSFGAGPAFCSSNFSGHKKKPGNTKDSRFFGVLLLQLTKVASLHSTLNQKKDFLLSSANLLQL